METGPWPVVAQCYGLQQSCLGWQSLAIIVIDQGFVALGAAIPLQPPANWGQIHVPSLFFVFEIFNSLLNDVASTG